jgi:hypothetical protein
MPCTRHERDPERHRERAGRHGLGELAELLTVLACVSPGCARGSAEPTRPQTAEVVAEPRAAHRADQRARVHGWGRPTAGLAWLPEGARYLVSISAEEDLTLEVVDARGRRLARLELWAAPEHAPSFTLAEVELRLVDLDGAHARVVAWAHAGSITGALELDGRAASWRVGLGADGSLAGQRWSRRVREAGLARLGRTHALLDDLAGLALALERCELGERLALATLALELGARAWAGVGRARLPAVGDFAPAGCPE